MKLLLAMAMFAATASCQTFPASAHLDAAIQQAIAKDRIPGAVLIVGHNGEIVHRKAYGHRALVPTPEKMTVDTIFDCASLTKVIATTTGMMRLFEEGKVRIADPVTNYLPEFQGGKSDITVRDLMTHFSGLRPDLDLHPAWSGYETGVERALHDPPINPRGVKFVYSDINFVLLGEIVHRLSGEMENDYLRRILFEPLGMRDSMFNPPASLNSRIAPTEKLKEGELLRGVVHDPTARYMGGVAGHAGLFSTADDLARFCQMLLGKGEWKGTRLFSALTIDKFTSPNTPPNQPTVRGLGWDIDSPLSGNRGELFPVGSYGHTGFTGTSIWIDPFSQTYVILLANSVHPHLRPSITSLRGRVATIVAAQVGVEAPPAPLQTQAPVREPERNAQVMTGLDVLARDGFRAFQGKRIGLITNHTGIDREGRRSIDRMIAAGVKIAAVYSPEHGFFGVEDRENIGDTADPKTGIKVISLFAAKNLRPTPEMLRGIDVLIFDIQDVGARFYTYVSTMAYGMEEAARAHIPYYVLDRPNPITGTHVEGPMLDPDKLSFVGYFPLPLRHGMTIGELAKMFNAENKIGADLTVVPMEGWQRRDWFDSTGLPWVNPSPNIRNLNQALLYPGVALLEYSQNYSVGRGTEAPFEMIGSEFIDAREFAAYLNKREIPGVRAYPERFQPASSHLAGIAIQGVRFLVTDRDRVDSSRLGLEIAAGLQVLYPGKIDFEANRKLIGSGDTITGLSKGQDPQALARQQEGRVNAFLLTRSKYLMYQ